MFRTLRKKTAQGIAVVGVGVVLLAGCSTGGGTDEPADEGFGNESITIVIPTAAGGGLDTTFRQLQPYLEEALGTSVIVENVEGGNTAIGNTRVAQDENCTTILAQAIPHVLFSYITQPVDYDLQSFAPIAGVTIEPSVIRVANDAPWDTIEDLVDDAKERPGEISFSVSERASSNYIGLLALEEALDVDFNIVPFGGGGPARTAVVAGEVDATHAGAFGSLAIADDSRVLAVDEPENLWPDITDDAPTTGEALGVDLESSGSTYNLWSSAACEEDFAGRHSALVEATRGALENEDYLADLEAVGEQDKVNFLEPDDLLALAVETEKRLKELVAEDPDAFIS